jgi:transcription-repair coupling factor (superfamily II helicase)
VERLTDILVRIEGDERVVALARALGEGRRAVATGAVGSSPVFCAAALARRTGRPVVMVVAHLDDADEALDECRGLGLPAWRLPALEALPGESGVSLDLFAERLGVVRDVLALGDGPGLVTAPGLVIAPIQALMQGVPAPAKLESLVRTIRKGEEHDLAGLIRWLDGAGYRRVEAVEEPGDFAVRGGILDVFAPGTSDELADPAGPVLTGAAVRLDFFGDTIDQCREIDLETMGSDRSVGGVRLVCVDVKAAGAEDGAVNFLELLPRRCVGVLVETMEVVEQGRGYFERLIDSKGMFGPPAVLRILEQRFHALAELNQFSGGATSADERVELAVAALPTFSRDAQQAVGELAQMALEGRGAVIVACQKEAEAQRLGELVAEFGGAAQGRIGSLVGYVHRGFAWDEGGSGGFTLVPYHELLGRFTTRRRQGRIQSGRAMDTFLDLQVGDYVVHQDHGIARFSGLTQMKPRELPGASRTQLLSEKKPAPDRKSGEQRAGELEEFLTLEFAGRAGFTSRRRRSTRSRSTSAGSPASRPSPPWAGSAGRTRRSASPRASRTWPRNCCACGRRASTCRGCSTRPTPRGRRSSRPSSLRPKPRTSSRPSARDQEGHAEPAPMDRLICGDVGFGKTELAIRAAFKACEFGKQVAVLVPTTVLAEQHERTFKEPLCRLPVPDREHLTLQERQGGRRDARRAPEGPCRRDHRHAPAPVAGCPVQ